MDLRDPVHPGYTNGVTNFPDLSLTGRGHASVKLDGDYTMEEATRILVAVKLGDLSADEEREVSK